MQTTQIQHSQNLTNIFQQQQAETREREQEEKDFKIIGGLLHELFDGNIKMEKQEHKNHHDLRATGYTSNGTLLKEYAIDLKENKQIANFPFMPLTVKKFLFMRENLRPNERNIIIYFNTIEWYIFDLTDFKFDEYKISNWKVKRREYDAKSEWEYTPTIWLPKDKAILHGKFQLCQQLSD